jgi:hypothetical protein
MISLLLLLLLLPRPILHLLVGEVRGDDVELV